MSAEVAHFFDVDDTLENRQILARLWQVLRVYFGGSRTLDKLFSKYNSIDDIPELKQEHPENNDLEIHVRDIAKPLELAKKFIERASKYFHSIRTVIPGVIGLLEEIKNTSTPPGIVTGRRNHTEWINTTSENFGANKLGEYFNEKYFTPHGMKSALRKAIVIKDKLRSHTKVKFYEDDVETAVFLALTFGDELEIVVIYHALNIPLYDKLQIKYLKNIKLLDVTNNRYIQ